MTNNHDISTPLPAELLEKLNNPVTEESGVMPPTVFSESDVDRKILDVGKLLAEKLKAKTDNKS